MTPEESDAIWVKAYDHSVELLERAKKDGLAEPVTHEGVLSHLLAACALGKAGGLGKDDIILAINRNWSAISIADKSGRSTVYHDDEKSL